VSGDSVTFYQGNGSQRSWRRAPPCRAPRGYCSSRTSLASCALPLVFPAVPIERRALRRWFDAPVGARQCSAASRWRGECLVIAVGSTAPGERIVDDVRVSPSLAQIAGHMLNAHLCRYVGYGSRATATGEPDSGQCARGHWVALESPDLKAIDTLVYPAQRAKLMRSPRLMRGNCPVRMRFLARRLGVSGSERWRGVLSYLLFERGYCRRLIDLGFADGHESA